MKSETPFFSLYGDAVWTEKILDFQGNFRKFEGLRVEIKKKPLMEIWPYPSGNLYQGQAVTDRHGL